MVWPVGCTEDNDLAVFMAHSDVVFPDTEALPLRVEGDRIHCPGVCDDTANVVAMLMAAKYIVEQKLAPMDMGVLIVVNSAEEGLGNLKGCRQIMADYGHRIKEFVTFDDKNGQGVDRAVGSVRYRVAVETEGGHSFSNFGRDNAIAKLSALITDLYTVEVPDYGKTTYNVGTIEGGTSVNTIAQRAEMLYEFRSDDQRGLVYMQHRFEEIIAAHRVKGVNITVTEVGNRPCGGEIDLGGQEAMKQRANDIALETLGRPMRFKTGSTDCNIPLSLGIPSICVGCCDGDGCHTREEYLDIKGIYPGLCMAFGMILHHFE
ncbi:MAG: M20/M25/M40 family metallo-hydrolase [Oscillospiraceae bacterium]|nr:M20/M25/M40 family metallo-hydrolase [Oscillospiraceae bacterium]